MSFKREGDDHSLLNDTKVNKRGHSKSVNVTIIKCLPRASLNIDI